MKKTTTITKTRLKGAFICVKPFKTIKKGDTIPDCEYRALSSSERSNFDKL